MGKEGKGKERVTRRREDAKTQRRRDAKDLKGGRSAAEIQRFCGASSFFGVFAALRDLLFLLMNRPLPHHFTKRPFRLELRWIARFLGVWSSELWALARQMTVVEAKMVLDERGDEVVAVVVPFTLVEFQLVTLLIAHGT